MLRYTVVAMKKIYIDVNKAKSLYLDEKKSLREIAKFFGVSRDTITINLEKSGVQMRSGGRQRIPIKEGDVYGNLTVLRAVIAKSKHPKYILKCICGAETQRSASSLMQGGYKGCWDCRNIYISQKKWTGFGEISGDFWDKVKRSAKCRNFEFNLTIEFCWNLFLRQNRKCALSGVDLIFTRRKEYRGHITASLDRINSSLHYTEDNVQWVHKTLNNLKMDLSEEEFFNWCNLISNFQRKKHACSCSDS